MTSYQLGVLAKRAQQATNLPSFYSNDPVTWKQLANAPWKQKGRWLFEGLGQPGELFAIAKDELSGNTKTIRDQNQMARTFGALRRKQQGGTTNQPPAVAQAQVAPSTNRPPEIAKVSPQPNMGPPTVQPGQARNLR